MGIFDFLNVHRLFRNKSVGTDEEKKKGNAHDKGIEQQNDQIEPFVFNANRVTGTDFGNATKTDCNITISLRKKIHGCRNKVRSGQVYVVKIFDNNSKKHIMPNLAMTVTKITSYEIELEGCSIMAINSDIKYYMRIYYEDEVKECTLDKYGDTLTRFTYTRSDEQQSERNELSLTKFEKYANVAREAEMNKDNGVASFNATRVYCFLEKNKNQINSISNVQNVAFALGLFWINHEWRNIYAKKMVFSYGMVYYFLNRAIKENETKDPYLYIFRLYMAYTCREVLLELFACADGTGCDCHKEKIASYSPREYVKALDAVEYIQMKDILADPAIIDSLYQSQSYKYTGYEDGSDSVNLKYLIQEMLGTYYQIYSRHRFIPNDEIIAIGNKNQDKVYEYLKTKIESQDFDFYNNDRCQQALENNGGTVGEKIIGMQSQDFDIKPFVFKANCYKRYVDWKLTKKLQKCQKLVIVERNENGCQEYGLSHGSRYIVKILYDDIHSAWLGDRNKPSLEEIPMERVRKTDSYIELRGFPIERETSMGDGKWISNQNYGLMVYYAGEDVTKCVLHIYDRNAFIIYSYVNEEPQHGGVKAGVDGRTECERYAAMAKQTASSGNISMAQQYGMRAYESIVKERKQVNAIKDVQVVALALGRLMEGEYFRDDESIKRATGLTYYFLSKAIKTCAEKDPYLYVYRCSLCWEYNKVFYHFFARSEGGVYRPNTNNPLDRMDEAVYDHHLEGMQMADVLAEPRVRSLDTALSNIFDQTYARYCATSDEQIIKIGNQYHEQMYNYLKAKAEAQDFDF